MRALRITVFILMFLTLAAELMRHSYVRWIEHHASALDRYEPIDREIRDATSLDALEKRYAEELEKEKASKGPEKSDGYGSPSYKLRQAISDWERRENEIRELRFFWVGGLVCLLLAVVSHWRRSEWLSITLQITGFAEMAWWTGPSLRLIGSQQEFTRLLDNKIAFTILALVLLLIFWFTGVLRPDGTRDRATS